MVVFDYGGLNGFDVVVFYGFDDGMLYVVCGDKIDLIGGKEFWGFVVFEIFKWFKWMMDNDLLVDFFGVMVLGVKVKEYFFDGFIVIYKSGFMVWIFLIMCWGGRVVYVFDVLNFLMFSLFWCKGCFMDSIIDDIDCMIDWVSIG